MGHNRGVSGGHSGLYRLESLAQRSDLVDLHEYRVGHAQLDAAREPFRARNEEVIPHDLDSVAQALGELLPAVPVLLVHAVLDGEDRIARAHLVPVGSQLGGGQLAALMLEAVDAVGVDLARRGIERNTYLHARLVTRRLDPLDERLKRLFV